MYKSILQGNIEKQEEDNSFEEAFKLIEQIDKKIILIDNAYFLQEYFNEHQLDSTTLEVICKYNNVIDQLNIKLPAIESLDQNLYSTDQFQLELSKKLEIANEGLWNLLKTLGGIIKKGWNFFFRRVNLYADKLDNAFQELDRKYVDEFFNAQDAKLVKVEVYSIIFVRSVIDDINSLFKKNKSSESDDQYDYSQLNDRETKHFNKAGFNYRKLSKNLQVFQDKNKGKISTNLNFVYENMFKKGTHSEAYQMVGRLKNLIDAIHANKKQLEMAINSQKEKDLKNINASEEGRFTGNIDNINKKKKVNPNRRIKDLYQKYKTNYLEINYTCKCIGSIMENYSSLSQKCLKYFKQKEGK